jgi:exodeoxyribonuclease V alpha subunit
MSVHKSQGSEFQHVFMLLPDGAEVFGREVLYTAATRSKQKLTIWGENNTIEETLKNVSKRVSGINKMRSINKSGNNI